MSTRAASSRAGAGPCRSPTASSGTTGPDSARGSRGAAARAGGSANACPTGSARPGRASSSSSRRSADAGPAGAGATRSASPARPCGAANPGSAGRCAGSAAGASSAAATATAAAPATAPASAAAPFREGDADVGDERHHGNERRGQKNEHENCGGSARGAEQADHRRYPQFEWPAVYTKPCWDCDSRPSLGQSGEHSNGISAETRARRMGPLSRLRFWR